MASGKVCTKCGETKPLDDFHRNKTKADGRRQECKECVREYGRRYREENHDKVRELNRRYYEENRDELREYASRYREENRDKVRDRNRSYRKENRDKVLECQRRYYEESRDKALEYQRRYHEENRDKVRDRKRRYREENRDIINQGQKIRYAQNTRISNLLTSKKGVPYSPEEDALILCDNGMTDYQKAIELGRNYGSVTARKYRLRRRPGRTEQSAQKKTPLHEQRGQKEFRKGLDMNATALPTWEELSARHEEAMRRCMAYCFGPEGKKQQAMTDLWDISVQMKEGRFQ